MIIVKRMIKMRTKKDDDDNIHDDDDEEERRRMVVFSGKVVLGRSDHSYIVFAVWRQSRPESFLIKSHQM